MATHRLSHATRHLAVRAALGVTLAATAVFGAVAPAAADSHQHAGSATETQAETSAVSVTAEQVLALARAQIGTSENAYGGGTKFQKWYAASQRAAETIARDGGNRAAYLNAAWCAMFVSWVGENAGARSQIGWDAYTVTHAQWFADNGRWGTTPKPGAVVFFAWNGGKSLSSIDHVGFVVKDNGNGTLTTIEGNTGNGKVEERVRPTWQVVGYGYPQYTS
ncbi:CHAP domain-containing protein [Nonomuraea sp. NPDC048916]|uniref:CHAP domain-containing protein n=1 Tax=Nonomuraea sp. NPDC048916 TaxID=3154232 RepID=UPI0033D997DB